MCRGCRMGTLPGQREVETTGGGRPPVLKSVLLEVLLVVFDGKDLVFLRTKSPWFSVYS